MSKCAFCDRESYTGSYTDPSMCARHFDLTLVAHRADLREESVGREAIWRELDLLPTETRASLSFLKKEVPLLLKQMQERGYVFFDSRRRLRIRKCAVTNSKGGKRGNTY